MTWPRCPPDEIAASQPVRHPNGQGGPRGGRPASDNQRPHGASSARDDRSPSGSRLAALLGSDGIHPCLQGGDPFSEVDVLLREEPEHQRLNWRCGPLHQSVMVIESSLLGGFHDLSPRGAAKATPQALPCVDDERDQPHDGRCRPGNVQNLKARLVLHEDDGVAPLVGQLPGVPLVVAPCLKDLLGFQRLKQVKQGRVVAGVGHLPELEGEYSPVRVTPQFAGSCSELRSKVLGSVPHGHALVPWREPVVVEVLVGVAHSSLTHLLAASPAGDRGGQAGVSNGPPIIPTRKGSGDGETRRATASSRGPPRGPSRGRALDGRGRFPHHFCRDPSTPACAGRFPARRDPANPRGTQSLGRLNFSLNRVVTRADREMALHIGLYGKAE